MCAGCFGISRGFFKKRTFYSSLQKSVRSFLNYFDHYIFLYAVRGEKVTVFI